MQRLSEEALSNFCIFETDEFMKKLGNFSSRDATFLRNKLDDYVYPQINSEPFWGKNIKKLQGYSPDMWRYRIGMFRLFYIVDKKEKTIYIITIDNRKDSYK